MLAVNFPAIKPSSSSYTAASFAIGERNWREVLTYRQLRGAAASKAGLTLNFDNISDAQALLIAQCWINANGSQRLLLLPVELVAGITSLNLVNRIVDQVYGLAWRFASAPICDSVIAGVSSVRVELVGSLQIETTNTATVIGIVRPSPPIP